MFDFANILFAGPCNRFCPFCIGQQLPDPVNVDNLDVYPPRGIEAFIDAVNHHQVANIVFTGTVTDPHLRIERDPETGPDLEKNRKMALRVAQKGAYV